MTIVEHENSTNLRISQGFRDFQTFYFPEELKIQLKFYLTAQPSEPELTLKCGHASLPDFHYVVLLLVENNLLLVIHPAIAWQPDMISESLLINTQSHNDLQALRGSPPRAPTIRLRGMSSHGVYYLAFLVA